MFLLLLKRWFTLDFSAVSPRQGSSFYSCVASVAPLVIKHFQNTFHLKLLARKCAETHTPTHTRTHISEHTERRRGRRSQISQFVRQHAHAGLLHICLCALNLSHFPSQSISQQRPARSHKCLLCVQASSSATVEGDKKKKNPTTHIRHHRELCCVEHFKEQIFDNNGPQIIHGGCEACHQRPQQ